ASATGLESLGGAARTRDVLRVNLFGHRLEDSCVGALEVDRVAHDHVGRAAARRQVLKARREVIGLNLVERKILVRLVGPGTVLGLGEPKTLRANESRRIKHIWNVLFVIPAVVLGILAGRGVGQNDESVFLCHDSIASVWICAAARFAFALAPHSNPVDGKLPKSQIIFVTAWVGVLILSF